MEIFFRVIKYAWLKKWLTIWTFTISIVIVITDALTPLIIKQIFDFLEKGIRSGNQSFSLQTFIFLFVVYTSVALTQVIFRLFDNYYTPKWWFATRNVVATKVFAHLERMSITFFEKRSTGKLVERVSSGVSSIQNILEGVIQDIVPQFFYIIFAAYVLTRVNLIFGLVIIIGVPVFVYVSLHFTKSLNKLQDKVRDYEEQASTVRVETFSNIKTVKSFATEGRHLNEIVKILDKIMNAFLKRMKKYVQMNTIRFGITNFSNIFILALGTYLVLQGEFTIGTLTMVWLYTSRVFQPLWSLSRLYDRIQMNMRSVKRVFEILDTKPDIEDAKNAISLEKVEGEVEFSRVKFKYKNRNVLNGLNLKIKEGQIIAIIGRSGVGKSTLVKLLLRFYDPQEGQILVDGHDIRTITQKSLRENIGVVLQDTAIFNDTAYNNIAYANPKAGKEEVLKAAKVAHADEFIKNLPEGYSTVVGERGVKLSGGEQQRINIARAVLKNPPILVLDEATSHLDSESEKFIQDALWKLIEGRTSVIIAHRLSTVMKADLIVVLDKGKISETGTHDELVKKEGIYNKLFKIQSGSYLK